MAKVKDLCEAQQVFLQVLRDQPIPHLKSVIAFARSEDCPGFVLIFDQVPTTSDVDYVLERYFSVQDKTPWPAAVHFFKDISASYLRSPDNLWDYDPWGEHSLLPSDLRHLAKSLWVVYGEDLHFKPPELLHTNLPPLPFSRSEFLEMVRAYPQLYSPFLDERSIWRRQEHIVSRPGLLQIFQQELRQWKAGKACKHLHLYGRIWGSGKTQTMYEWMRLCKAKKIPFVYRMWAAKDDKGNIMEDSSHLNTASQVAAWIREIAPSQSFVLFLDEVDVNPVEFPECLIISGAKELPEFYRSNRKRWHILDMIREFPFSNTALLTLLSNTIKKSTKAKALFSRNQLEAIVVNAHMRGFPQLQPIPLLIRALAYSIMMGLLRKGSKLHHLVNMDVRMGILLASCPWMVHYGSVHDVHAEYFVFDGSRYLEVDPFNPTFTP